MDRGLQDPERPPTAPADRGRSGSGSSSGEAPPGFSGRFMAPLLLGSVLNPLNTTAIATGLVAIGRDFGVGPSGTGWLVSSLYFASAVAQPVMGRLADLLGPRRVFLSGLVLVCAAGLLGTLAPGFAWLIVARVLLGVGTSAAYPAAMTMLRVEAARVGHEPPRTVLGRLSLAALGSAAVGPALGGLLTATTGWRGIFAFNVPLALIPLVLGLRLLPRDGDRRTTGGDEPQPQPRPQTERTPLPALLRDGPLARTYLRHGLTYLTLYCTLYGFTQWLEEAHGYSSLGTGLLMLPMSGAAALCSLLGARTKGIRAPLVTVSVLLALGSGSLLLTDSGTPVALLLLTSALFGVPQGLASTGNQAAVYTQAPPGGVGAAAGLQRTAQYAGAIAATGLLGLCFGARPTDTGLHQLAAVTGVLGLLVVVLTVTDRALRTRE
ncbi:MFS transporter [Streptomyces sp. UNOC14_S4]|uniref:MFS transporter n=1 Tax=Streptomyces sp. UNOC14_S4 TaxID=2872340 RepID=UPI001E2E3E0A|nr:MFS transporter [Streptomyces sp. UNOC14_S4]